MKKNSIMICLMATKSTIPFWDFVTKQIFIHENFKGLQLPWQLKHEG